MGASEVPWLARPMPPESQLLLAQVVASLFVVAGVGGLLTLSFAADAVLHTLTLAVISTAALAIGGLLLLLVWRHMSFVDRHLTGLVCLLIGLASLLVTIAQYSTGPNYVVALIVYFEIPIFAFYLLRSPLPYAVLALIGLESALLLMLQDGYRAPLAQWMYLMATLSAVGVTFGGLLKRGVEESLRLERLRRFLAPQVADAVLSSGSEPLLAPHRRQIAVFFCDLRGFTAFAASHEPEDVVEVLGEYYEAVGALLREAEATVGTFAGDGVMAYFNDPVPCEEPARRAVQVALDLQAPMADLCERWSKRGFHVGYGVGVAYGYATLGAIGFEGRNDYTALGSVVNLAARLSDEAGPGEILVDRRTYNAVEELVGAVPKTLEIKGFAAPVSAFSLQPALNGDSVVPPPSVQHVTNRLE